MYFIFTPLTKKDYSPRFQSTYLNYSSWVDLHFLVFLDPQSSCQISLLSHLSILILVLSSRYLICFQIPDLQMKAEIKFPCDLKINRMCSVTISFHMQLFRMMDFFIGIFYMHHSFLHEQKSLPIGEFYLSRLF